jgi:hypothetical protein
MSRAKAAVVAVVVVLMMQQCAAFSCISVSPAAVGVQMQLKAGEHAAGRMHISRRSVQVQVCASCNRTVDPLFRTDHSFS